MKITVKSRRGLMRQDMVSLPILEHGRLAQLGERQPYKLDVTGSSPVPPTMFSIGYGI